MGEATCFPPRGYLFAHRDAPAPFEHELIESLQCAARLRLREMVEIARGKSIYRNLECFSPDKVIPVKQNEYSIITAIGVISVGAAPITIFDQVFDLLPQNGLFAFSFNEHSLMDPEYSLKVEETVEEKKAEQLFCELGPHILKRDLKSMVYVIKKL